MKKFGVLLAVAAMVAGLAGPALAKAPTETTVAKTGDATAPVVLVDSKGTVSVLWTAVNSQGFPTVKYARKPAGASHYTPVALPALPGGSYDFDPFIYEVSSGVLQVLVDQDGGSLGVFGFRSTNDGKSWKSMDTSGLTSKALTDNNIYIHSSELQPAPGGPIMYAGLTGAAGAVVQIKPDLTGVTTIATNTQALLGLKLARTPGGTTFQVGVGTTTTTFPFQAGTHTGQVSFPACTATQVSTSVAATHSLAVIAEAGCGRVRTRTISAGGTVGPMHVIGRSISDTGAGRAGDPWVRMVSDRQGHLTAAFVLPGGDLGVSHSSNGLHWKAAPGSVPVADSFATFYGEAPTISTGTPTYYGVNAATSNTRYAVRTIPLAATYKAPKAPSGHGISSPRKVAIGSLATTFPGKVALKAFRKKGHLTLRLVEAIAGKLTIEVGVSHTTKSTIYDLCGGQKVVKAKAHKVMTVTTTCAGSGIVIGGVDDQVRPVPAISIRKGDDVSIQLVSRNGTLSVTAHIA